MTPDDPRQPSRPDDDVTAAEYLIGLLDETERRAFERRLADDPASAAQLREWQQRLAPLNDAVAPRDPPPALWARIAASTVSRPADSFGSAGSLDSGGSFDPLDSPDPLGSSGSLGSAGSRSTSLPASPRPGWRQRLSAGSLAAAGALVAAAVVAAIALVIVLRGAPFTERVLYTAVLQTNDGRTAGWLVEVLGDRSVRLRPTVATEVPEGRAIEFWTKAEGAAAPVSLGLVPADRATLIPAQRVPAVGENQLFELTLEAAGGSPIGRPTGPILFVGRAVAAM